MQLRLCLRAIAVCLIAMSGVAAAQPIEWTLGDRFRLFDEGGAAASRVERLLGEMGSVSRVSAGGQLAARYRDLLDTLSGPSAAALRRSNWRTEARLYRATYLYPDRYRIDAKLGSAERRSAGAALCRWSVTVASGPRTYPDQPCAAAIALDIPAGAAGGRWEGRAMAWVEVIGTGRSYGASIRVEDVLIVALGDSFISGEGNPDVPADFSAVRPGPGFQRAQWPDRARLPVVRAQWWDEPCHRSLLSWPVLASLYEASRNPRRAVTLVHLGCSGAEVHDGLVEPQNGREPGDSGLPGCPSGQEPRTCPPGGRETQSQLEMLRDLLLAHPESASARPIDRVFLSIGGNDIGFVGVIKYLALPPNGFAGGGLIPRFLLRMPQAEIVCPLRAGDDGRAEATVLRRFCGSRLTAQERLRELPVYYGELRAAFDALQIDPAHIYQTAYPNILEDTPGPAGESRFCQHALTEEAIAALDESRRPAESLYAGNHPDRLYPHGFEAMQGVLPWYLRWRTQWSFHFAHNAGESCHWPAIRSTSSETCKADWVWRELNGALASTRGRSTPPIAPILRSPRRPWTRHFLRAANDRPRPGSALDTRGGHLRY